MGWCFSQGASEAIALMGGRDGAESRACQDFFWVQCSSLPWWRVVLESVQFSWVTRSCPTLCYPIDCSTPGFPDYHQLLELDQTHVHRVSDAIQPFHPLSSPSLPAFNLFQHQGLFHWVSYLHQVAKLLGLQIQHQSFQWIFRIPWGLTDLISLQSKGLSRVFSNTTAQKHQFFESQLSL